MKQYTASVNIITESHITNSSLALLLGIDAAILDMRILESNLLWTIDSGIDDSLTLEEHVTSLMGIFPTNKRIMPIPPITNIFITIGVYYDTVTCTVSLSSDYLNLITSIFPKMTLETVCYPCEENGT